MKRIEALAGWVTRHELWLAALAAPLLLFPVHAAFPFVGLSIFAITWTARKACAGRFSYATRVDLPLIVLVAAFVMGYSVSLDPQMSWTRMWNYLLGVLVFYSLVNAFKPGRHVQSFVIFTALLTTGIVLVSLVGVNWSGVRFFQLGWLYDRFPMLLPGLPGSGVPRESDFINARVVGITLGILLPFLTAFLLFGSRGKYRAVIALAAALAFLDLLLTQSFQGVVGLAAGMVFLLSWRDRRFMILPALGLALAAAALFAVGPGVALAYLLSAENPVGIAIVLRLDMWGRAWAMIQDLPFTGIGMNTFSIVQSSFYPGYLIGPEPHAHNLYLQTALDLGVVGLGAMLLFIFAWGVTVVRQSRAAPDEPQRLLYAAVAAAVISFLAQGFLDGMTLGAKTAPIVWAFLGAGAAPGLAIFQSPSPARATPWLRVVVPCVTLTALLAAILIFDPSSVHRNVGSYLAHHAMMDLGQSGSVPVEPLLRARSELVQAALASPGRSHLFLMLGRIDAWLGEPGPAIRSYAAAVELDGRGSLAQYDLPGAILHPVQPGERWERLMAVYRAWEIRFPDRAEGYLLCAIVYDRQVHNPAQAQGCLERGLSYPARPEGILREYLSAMKQPTSGFIR